VVVVVQYVRKSQRGRNLDFQCSLAKVIFVVVLFLESADSDGIRYVASSVGV